MTPEHDARSDYPELALMEQGLRGSYDRGTAEARQVLDEINHLRELAQV